MLASASLTSTRETRVGDAIRLLGFPSVVQGHELLNKSLVPDASVTTGAVSGFRLDAIGQRLIQTDAPAAHGSSGGPAIGGDPAVVGVMTFVSLSPTTGTVVQGFNFLIPADDVRRFLEDTDVHIGESRFNVAWAAALSAFFRGDAHAAVPKHLSWPSVALGSTLFGAGVCGGLCGRRWRSAVLGPVRWIRRALGTEAVRQRLIERLQAGQVAAYLGGSANVHVGEIGRLATVLDLQREYVLSDEPIGPTWSPRLPAAGSDGREEAAERLA